MDPLDVAGLGVDAFKLGYNLFTNQRDFDYQKALQQQMFEREDTAVQRRMADLKAAGINPNLAAGSAAGAGSVVSRSNTNDLGSALDTAQAVNTIRQQRQAVENAKIENSILKMKQSDQAADTTMKRIEIFNMLGLPFDVTLIPNKDGSFDYNFGYYGDGGEGYNTASKQNMPVYNLFNYNMQNQKNSADLLQRDVDWYTADKISGLTFGLFGLGNSASGWRKALGK